MMGRRDILTKKYMSEPKRFADFFNAVLYDGKPVIRPEDLSEMDSTEIVVPYSKGKKSVAMQKVRDIMKSCIVKRSRDSYLVLLGIENQTEVHYAMPVRQLLYNAMSYMMQVDAVAARHKAEMDLTGDAEYLSGFQKEDRLLPVITVTLYWGEEPWDGPVRLSDMLVPHSKSLDKYLEKSEINLFSIIGEERYKKCGEELRTVFEPLHYRNQADKFAEILSGEKYENVTKEQMELLVEFTDLKRPAKNREGGYSMCNAVREIRKESEQIGINKGLQQGIQTGRQKGFQEGLQEGLAALVNSLKLYIPDPVALWETIIKNGGYETVTLEQVKALL